MWRGLDIHIRLTDEQLLRRRGGGHCGRGTAAVVLSVRQPRVEDFSRIPTYRVLEFYLNFRIVIVLNMALRSIQICLFFRYEVYNYGHSLKISSHEDIQAGLQSLRISNFSFYKTSDISIRFQNMTKVVCVSIVCENFVVI